MNSIKQNLSRRYVQIIDRVTEQIVMRQTPETFEEISKEIISCRLEQKRITALMGFKKDSKQNVIIIPSRYVPDERLVGFVHEILHIFYLDVGIPNDGNDLLEASKDAYWYLEDIIELLSEDFALRYSDFFERLFEEKFGFSVYVSPLRTI